MAYLYEGLYAHLTTAVAVAALVATRVYPNRIPQDAALPAIAYQQISGPRDHSQNGATGLVEARVQITCHAATYTGAHALARAVRQCMDGLRGSMGGLTLDSCVLDNEIDGWGEVYELPTVRQDYRISFQEE